MRELFALILEKLTRELAESSPLDFLVKLLAALIILLPLYLARNLLVRLWHWLLLCVNAWWHSQKQLLTKIADLEARLRRGLEAVERADHGTHQSEGKGLWLTKPVEPPWSDQVPSQVG